MNGGTSVYGTSKERHRQRATPAHSTMVVDSLDSTEVWGGFRVARRARVTEAHAWQEGDVCAAVAAHDGYRRLSGKPLHRRSWRLRPGHLRITDELLGGGVHEAEIIFPFAPGLHPMIAGERTVNVMEEATQSLVLTLRTSTEATVFVEPTTWHPAFGKIVKNWRVRLVLRGALPLIHESVLSWDH